MNQLSTALFANSGRKFSPHISKYGRRAKVYHSPGINIRSLTLLVTASGRGLESLPRFFMITSLEVFAVEQTQQRLDWIARCNRRSFSLSHIYYDQKCRHALLSEKRCKRLTSTLGSAPNRCGGCKCENSLKLSDPYWTTRDRWEKSPESRCSVVMKTYLVCGGVRESNRTW